MQERSRLSQAVQTGLKAGLIGFLTLLFLIPIGMIREIRSEREGSMESAREDISSKAGGETTLSTPFLTIPVRYETRETNAKGETVTRTRREIFCVFPETLSVSGVTRVSLRSRGIYSVPVHQSDVTMDVVFSFDTGETGISGARADWGAARLYYAYEDSRSLRESPVLLTGSGTQKPLRSDAPPIDLAGRAVSIPIRMERDSAAGSGRFAARLELKLSGAESLYFMPLADTNTLKLSCDWASPSFAGYRLPAARELGEAGFTAEWFVDETARALPRILKTGDFRPESVQGVDFGVGFLQPADVYQQTHRALRYAVLFLFIPFAALFLFEVLLRRKLHVVQYILIGLANCVFYLLLLALAEHIPFTAAYLASAASVSVLMTFYVSAFLPRRRSAVFVFAALSLQYAYLFCALKSEDYALLIGSIGLFVIVAFTMTATRRIDWYGKKPGGAENDAGAPPGPAGREEDADTP